jgi:tetraacyldisaccharide 4'-kinase
MIKLFLFFLIPFTWLYRLGFYLDRKFKKKHKLQNVFTISVGNLTTGGTGKTPLTIYLSKLIYSTFSDVEVVVLSRGYRGEGSKKGTEVEINSKFSVTGDEPLLIKNKVPNAKVIIGRNRVESFKRFFLNQEKNKTTTHYKNDNINGRFSPRFRSKFRSKYFLTKGNEETSFKLSQKKVVVILDDGFQHQAIQRDLDFLLVDSDNAFGNGYTLPLGNLRETIKAVKRVQYIFFTRYSKENSFNVEILKMKFLKLNPELKFYHLAYTPSPLSNSESKLISLNELKKYPVTVFSALGNPFSFETSIQLLNPKSIRYKRYPDHFPYTEKTILELYNKLEKEEILICTEKDYIKIKQLDLKKEILRKIYYFPVEVFIHKHFELKKDLEQKINSYFQMDSSDSSFKI